MLLDFPLHYFHCTNNKDKSVVQKPSKIKFTICNDYRRKNLKDTRFNDNLDFNAII